MISLCKSVHVQYQSKHKTLSIFIIIPLQYTVLYTKYLLWYSDEVSTYTNLCKSTLQHATVPLQTENSLEAAFK